MPAKFFRLLSVFLVMLLPAFGQTQAGLTGTVQDNTGAVIVDASVELTNTQTGATYNTTTNQSGNYTFSAPPGSYQLRCQFPSFKTFVRSGLVLETGLTKTVDITLEVGDVTERVEVTAATPLLESDDATVGQFIERETVANMPLESRRAASLVRLTGQVVFSGEGGAEQLPFFSMAGGRSRNQMWHMDGAVNQNMSLGIAQISLNPPIETLQEFKVESNNYSAEFGRTAGGLIQMTTRSGGNEFHGAGYEFFRNDELDARTFFSPEKAPLRFNVFGASIGGPIAKNRTFFFFNYEGSRRRTGRTFSNVDVPNPPEAEGDFSSRTDLTLLDPLTGEPFPNNTIPQSRIDPLGRQFAALFPEPNVASNLSQSPRDNFVANVSDALDQNFFTARVDHSLGPNDRVFGRFMYAEAPETVAAVFPDAFADFRGGTRDNEQTQWQGTWIHNFSPTVFTEVRYFYGNRLHINRAAGTGSGKNGEFGVPGVNPDFFATVIPTGLTQLGAGNHERLQTPILTQQITSNTTIVRGNHQFKVGGEYRFNSNEDDFNQFAGGQFLFNDRATGSGMASLLLGWVTDANLVDADVLETRSDNFAGFIQDDWTVTRTLTLNLGIRWEMDQPRWEENNRQSGFDPNAFNPVCQCPGAVTFSGRGGRSKFAHDFDENNWGPRFGLAWRARDKLVIRTGYGLSYNGVYARAAPFTQFNGFSLNGSFTSPDGGFTPAFRFREGMPAVTREELGPGLGAVPIGENPRLNPDFFQQNHVNGYAHQWNFTIQRELPFDMLAEAAYTANVGHKLGGPNVTINTVPLVAGQRGTAEAPRGPDEQDQTLRPFPQFNNVFHESPPWGNSSYHALNLKLEKRFTQGLSFLHNFTWSRFIDDVESASELGGEAGSGFQHIELRHLDKSLSGNDIRLRYVGNIVYDLPFGRGRAIPFQSALLDQIAGGWGISTIIEIRDGAPFGVIEQTNESNTFSGAPRPNLLRDPELPSRSTGEEVVEFFDTSAFAAPGNGVFGNAPRNICCGPGFLGIDFSVKKDFFVTERVDVKFRADFFNIINRANFANPGTVRGRGDFGRLSSLQGDSRQIQFNLRVEF